MSSDARIRILIADDHLVVRLGLDTLIRLQDDMCVVGAASTGAEVVDLYRVHRPDVTLMDLRMPGLAGAEAIAAIRETDPRARIIVLTIHKGDEAVYQAVRAGAKGYLLKDVGSEEILATIRAVHRGERSIPAEIASRVVDRLPQEPLTPRELDILRCIARGLGNKEAADALSISPATAKNYVARVIAKLGAQDRTHAVTLALERGVVDLEDLAPGRAADRGSPSG